MKYLKKYEQVKYPRSFHFNYSEKPSKDDKRHETDEHFIDKDVVVSIKLDGENTTIYDNYSHARSLDSNPDSEDRRWIESLRISKIQGNIPKSFRICGENMFYKHTCYYENLKSMFYVFSIWDNNKCLSWEETKDWCKLLNLITVPIIYEGIYNKELILKLFNEYIKENEIAEGFVCRLSGEFFMENFPQSLSKFVCNSFVLPDKHWKYSKKIPNKLKSGKNPWEII